MYWETLDTQLNMKNKTFCKQLFFRTLSGGYLRELFPNRSVHQVIALVFRPREGSAREFSDNELLSICTDVIEKSGQKGHFFLSDHRYFIFLVEETAGLGSRRFSQELLRTLTVEYGIYPGYYTSQVCCLTESLNQDIQNMLATVSLYTYYARQVAQDEMHAISNTKLQKTLQRIEQLCELGDTKQALQVLRSFVTAVHRECCPSMNVKRSVLRLMYGFSTVSSRYQHESVYYDIPHYIIEQMLKASTASMVEEIVDSFARYVMENDNSNLTVNIPVPVKRALEYIHANFRQELLLSDVADAVHLNKSYLSQLFQKSVNVPYSKYLEDLRLKEAKKLLRTTNMPASEIAELVGFSSQNYFTKVFKNRVGISPIKYRTSPTEEQRQPA